MAEETFYEIISRILSYEKRYRRDAYAFISDAVTFTVRKLSENTGRRTRHIRGDELIRGSVEFANREFGPLAWDVFQDWGVETGSDVGEIVYHLIHEKVLSASSDDSREDFNCIGDLSPLFHAGPPRPYVFPDHPKIE